MRVTSTTAPATSSLSTATHSPDVAFRVACHSGRQTSSRGSCTQPLPPPRGELKEKVSSMVAERFQMHSSLKAEAQKMLNSYLGASALYGEWRWEPAIGLRRTKRFGSPGQN